MRHRKAANWKQLAAFALSGGSMNLEDWRNEIDQIDRDIVRLIEQRVRIVRKIGAIKAGAGLPTMDRNREEKVLRNIRGAGTGSISDVAIVRIFSEILRESKSIQRQMISNAAKEGADVRW
jgi:chorismate mutase